MILLFLADVIPFGRSQDDFRDNNTQKIPSQR